MGFLTNAASLFDFSRKAGLNLDTNLSTGIASSFENSLSTIVGPSGFGTVPGEDEALSVPAVARAVQLYSVASAKLPVQGGAPEWWTRGAGALTPEGRLAAIVQSLFFHGKAVLWVSRDGAGNITDALLLPAQVFGLDLFGRVLLKGQNLPPAIEPNIIFIRSLLPQGFLDFGEDSVKHYLGLRDSILSRSRNPIPVVELKIRDAFEVTPDELDDARKNWQVARTSENGAVAVTPAGIDVIVHGDKADTAMLTEARTRSGWTSRTLRTSTLRYWTATTAPATRIRTRSRTKTNLRIYPWTRSLFPLNPGCLCRTSPAKAALPSALTVAR